jgi:hypothetical protein
MSGTNMVGRYTGSKLQQEHVKDLADYFRDNYLGQPVAVWCMRYIYRGVVKYVGENFLVLDGSKKCYAVETSGTVTGEKPEVEDLIPSDVIISMLAIEQIIQPSWVAYNLDL